MANETHAQWLREGTKKWNYRRKKVKFRPDLSGLRFFDFLPPDFRDSPKTSRYFEGIDLSDANLNGADLSDLNFYKANFEGADLTASDMSLSNFQKAKFVNAKLTGAKARFAQFNGALFLRSSVDRADLEGAGLSGAAFVETSTDKIANFPARFAPSSIFLTLDAYIKSKSDQKQIASPKRPPAGSIEALDDRISKKRYDVFFATNRNSIFTRGELVGFGVDQSDKLSYGVCEVIIPDGHRIGSVGSPLWKRVLSRSDDRLKLDRLISLSDDLFWKFISDTAKQMKSPADPTIFIHGFNTSFQDAVVRAAQIGYDIGIGQGVGLFSWPSKGRFLKYLADEAAVESSKYALATFIQSFCLNSPTRKINLIAHSMGCRCLIGAIEILSRTSRNTLNCVNQVILAAADVDSKIMPYQCGPAVGLCNRITSYTSDLDNALKFSGWLHSFPRVGIMPPTFVLSGVDTVVVNDIGLGDFKHGYVAPKFINKIDKYLISLRPNGQKCYNTSAVRRVLAG